MRQRRLIAPAARGKLFSMQNGGWRSNARQDGGFCALRKLGDADTPGALFPCNTSDPGLEWHKHCKRPSHAHTAKIKASSF